MRVLLVEDEKQIADDVCAALTHAGYVVESVGDGESAWFLADTEEFDAIVLDLGLPRLDGMTVLRRLRGNAVKTPIVILSARGSWSERVEGIDHGADDYIAKPFHVEELIARLSAVIRRAAGHTTTFLEAGRLRVDTRRLQVSVDGRPAALSALEFRALRYLIHHKGRVVPHAELAEHVYGGEREPDSNALEVLIARIRRKLGAATVTTRRGQGYMVEG